MGKDLCGEKKFIDLEDNLYINYEEDEIKSISDSKDNLWVLKSGNIEGGYGKVNFYKSTNKKYSDIVIKSIEKEEERFHEIKIILFFIENKCHNFLNSGVLKFKDFDYIVMEEVDNDVLNFFPTKNKNKIFKDFMRFLVSSYICAYNKGYIYTDIKTENIGIKKCNSKYVFTFLDFGSFFKLNSKNFDPSFTYIINEKAFEKFRFSPFLLYYFGTIIVILTFIIQIFKGPEETFYFIEIIEKLEKLEKYGNNNFLKIEYFEIIKNNFNQIMGEIQYTNFIIKYLNKLTYEEPPLEDFMEFLIKLRNIY